ncbi:UPF0313 protein [Bacteroidia bacterium]|nr:UPF0313 protein [Bacteroidia bacterium]
MAFLPITKDELINLGWDWVDVIIVTGDAYVDHPAFGAAVIGRMLEYHGFRVALLPQPNWRDDGRDFIKLGKPRLFFGVTAGAMDSMVNHYTAHKRLRSNDAYTPDGKSGFRPDYPTIVYTKLLKQLYPDTPVILGGIEASLRRLTHYDYWQDKLLPSILVQSEADMLVYGMGEHTIVKIAQALARGKSLQTQYNTAQTAFMVTRETLEQNWDTTFKNTPTHWLHAHAACVQDKRKQAENFVIFEQESNKIQSQRLIQPLLQDIRQETGMSCPNADQSYVVINPSAPPFTEQQMDESFDLPYTRLPHPKYRKRGVVPAYEMIRHSINIHRGCFGGCAFCTISAHQGKHSVCRSEQSILKELDNVVAMDDFKGHITDVGGPTANMYKMNGMTQSQCTLCSRYSCIHPKICPNLHIDHKPLIALYEKVRHHPKVKKLSIGSGIRYDLFDNESPNPDWDYAEYVIRYCVSGRLKVAPEHTELHVLNLLRKPSFDRFVQFKNFFDTCNRRHSLRQQLIPYFISSLPGCHIDDMYRLASTLKQIGHPTPETVQDFTPTPMTLATEMYYTGLNPYTMTPVACARTDKEKQAQKQIFFRR